MAELRSLFQTSTRPRRPLINIKKTVTIRTTGADGQSHEYHSLAEVPPELRAEIEKVQSELKQEFTLSSSDVLTTNILSKRSASVFSVRDASGNERVCHSLDEMPADIRAAFEDAKRKSK